MKRGFKMLDPTGATYYEGNETIYPLPGPGEKWGPEFIHPNPAEPDGYGCGLGRWHVMKKPDALYAPPNWWPWYVKSTGAIIGESAEKYGTTALRLRRISPKVWHRIIRLGWCSGADLYRADLSGADLSGADLGGANLSRADLSGTYYNKLTRWPTNFDMSRLEVTDD